MVGCGKCLVVNRVWVILSDVSITCGAHLDIKGSTMASVSVTLGGYVVGKSLGTNIRGGGIRR